MIYSDTGSGPLCCLLSHASPPLRLGHQPLKTNLLEYWQPPIQFFIKGQTTAAGTEGSLWRISKSLNSSPRQFPSRPWILSVSGPSEFNKFNSENWPLPYQIVGLLNELWGGKLWAESSVGLLICLWSRRGLQVEEPDPDHRMCLGEDTWIFFEMIRKPFSRSVFKRVALCMIPLMNCV